MNILAFADDVVKIAETMEETKALMEILIEETENVGLKINEAKTKFLEVKRDKRNGIGHL